MRNRQDQFPIGAQVTLAQMAENPYPTFHQMLAHEPVSWVPAFNLWMVTRRDDAIEIMRDADLYTMEPIAHSTGSGQINPMEDTFGSMMLSLDGPPHKRIRDVFVEPYRPKHSRTFYTDLITEITTRLLDTIEQELAQTESIDLDKAFSDPLAIYTVVATLGFEVDEAAQFREWYDDFAVAIGNVEMNESIRTRGKRAMQQFRSLVLTQIETLKHTPNNSVLSQLIHNQSVQLTADELVANVALTFFGGVKTTSAMLSNTIWALLRHPEQLAQVQHTPALLANALEESMRWESPVQAAMRFPVRDIVLHGVPIQRGEKIYCMLGAANRDPAFYPASGDFDIHRPNANKHLGFAYGPHFCLGAPLARLEGMIGLSMLLERLSGLRLDVEQLAAPYGHEFRATPTLFATA
ncbi:MAG: cytochrome P450 [Chloroflexota bacterium]